MSQIKTMTSKPAPHWHSGKRPSDEDVMLALRLYEGGMTLQQIGQKFGRVKSAIHRWIHEYAPLIVNTDMKTNDNNGNGDKRVAGFSTEKSTRVTGVTPPETAAAQESNEETLEQKVARLERELKDATLMRDFYNEMINVAEKQFNIPIRKKAGTRR